jgi:Leucine-rich repeat (LRR) protein
MLDGNKTSVVYRDAKLSQSMIEHYKNAIGEKKWWFGSAYGGDGFIKQWKDKQPQNISYRAIVKKAANGIITEGNQLNKSLEAQEIAKQLLDYKGNHQDDKVDEVHKDVEDDEHDKDHKMDIHRCVINICTMQSFLYELVNKTLRKNDETKIDTLGPYCYLLYYSWYMLDDNIITVVYRGAKLSQSMIEHYKNAIGEKKCWFGFTSTSQDRNITDNYGNAFFIIDMSFCSGLDVSKYSEYPAEQEVLLPPGTKFEIEKVEYDHQQEKHYIYIKLLSKNNILQQLISRINTATEMEMSGIHLDAIDTEVLSNVFKKNQTLTKLDLSYNCISAKGAEALADALKVNQTLTTLDLTRNYITGKGAKALANSLTVNRTLTALCLLYNHICDEGAKAFGDALRANQALTELDLSDNQISDKEAIALANALKINQTLTVVDLAGNEISDEGTEALGDAAKVRKTLITVNLHSSVPKFS